MEYRTTGMFGWVHGEEARPPVSSSRYVVLIRSDAIIS